MSGCDRLVLVEGLAQRDQQGMTGDSMHCLFFPDQRPQMHRIHPDLR
jgi:hypothetical protein